MLRSILVALDGSACSFTATTLALDWARRFDAKLEALGIVDEVSIRRPEPVPLGAGSYKKACERVRVEDAHHRVAGFLADFRARAMAAGARAEIVEELGDPAERILWEAQRVDIVMLGRETNFKFETPERRDATLAQVVRSGARSMVVVPATPTDGSGILVAYGGGREAARTLQIFTLLGLAAGETVDVLTVHRDSGDARAIARGAGDFLMTPGIMHRLHTLASAAAPAGVLLDEIRVRRPSLLVLGAHREHPFRGLFATSVTRALLAACPVPMFVGA